MKMAHVLVWDIETIPDISGFAAANNLLDKTAVEVRAAMGDKFPKHIYHSIICIGALIAHQDADHWVVDALGAPQAPHDPPASHRREYIGSQSRVAVHRS
jgi:hypothetical protein